MAGYYFPAGYQPNYYGGMYNPQPNVPQVPTPAQQPQQQGGNGLIWVQGETGAKGYLVAPNNTVLLMDSEANQFYLKSTDGSGMPLPLRVFKYERRRRLLLKAIPWSMSRKPNLTSSKQL